MKKQDTARWLCRYRLSKYREDIGSYRGREAEFHDRFEANYAWNEWVVKQSTSAKCLNRKVESLGTKSSGTWTLEVSITLS